MRKDTFIDDKCICRSFTIQEQACLMKFLSVGLTIYFKNIKMLPLLYS